MLNNLKSRWDAALASRNRDLDGTAFIQRAMAARRLRRRRRAAIAELESLPDYLLDDIGIARADIPRAVDGLIAGGTRPIAPTRAQPVEEPRDRLRRAA
jgi:uncharacterized protein YjiS (DUF1127 family)